MSHRSLGAVNQPLFPSMLAKASNTRCGRRPFVPRSEGRSDVEKDTLKIVTKHGKINPSKRSFEMLPGVGPKWPDYADNGWPDYADS